MNGVDDDTASRAWATVRETLEARSSSEGIAFNGAAWLVSAKPKK